MSLSYETALKLRDAGYPMTQSVFEASMGMVLGDLPFNDQGYLLCKSLDPVRVVDYSKVGIECYPSAPNPTLEELLEQCGSEVVLMYELEPGRCLAAKNGKILDGATPREAVANLWLALRPLRAHEIIIIRHRAYQGGQA